MVPGAVEAGSPVDLLNATHAQWPPPVEAVAVDAVELVLVPPQAEHRNVPARVRELRGVGGWERVGAARRCVCVCVFVRKYVLLCTHACRYVYVYIICFSRRNSH